VEELLRWNLKLVISYEEDGLNLLHEATGITLHICGTQKSSSDRLTLTLTLDFQIEYLVGAKESSLSQNLPENKLVMV
jgi:hypothetical protein